MDKSKQTPADRAGPRTKRQPRDPSPDRKRGWNPADDIFGDKQRPVDADMDLEDGKYSKRPPKP